VRFVIEEPVAAGVGFAHLEGLKPGRTLIYDFGGGSFDAAVLDVDDSVSRVTVLASAGVYNLGGDDIDQMIVKHLLQQIGQAYGLTMSEVQTLLDPFDDRELMQKAEDAKIALSDLDTVDLSLNLSLSQSPQHCRLTRHTLEEMLTQQKRFDRQALFDRSMSCVGDVLRRAKAYDLMQARQRSIGAEELSRLPMESLVQEIKTVLPVGGVAKIPYIRSRLADVFGRRRIYEGVLLNDPVEAVAQGAALDKEYDNLLLAAPPYSVVLESERDGQWKHVFELYTAYDLLWPNSRSYLKTDIRFVSESVEISRMARVCLVRPDDPEPIVIHERVSPGYVRIEIDLAARIHILWGPTIREMHTCAMVRAPWQHRLQVINEPSMVDTRLLDNTRTIFTEK
jgi:hypothetical protein